MGEDRVERGYETFKELTELPDFQDLQASESGGGGSWGGEAEKLPWI